MSTDLMGPKGIMAARSVVSLTCSANPPTYSALRDWRTGSALVAAVVELEVVAEEEGDFSIV